MVENCERKMDEKPLFGSGSNPSKRPAGQASSPVNSAGAERRPLARENPPLPIPPGPQTQQAVPPKPVPPTPVLQTPVPQTPVPQAPVPPTPVLQTPVPQTPVPQTPVPQTPVPPALEVPTQQTGSPEDRKESRNRTLKGGLIVLPGQMMSSFACKIRNESRGGVMLVLDDVVRLPAEFYLIRTADPGHQVPCRVAWRGIGRVGVQFVAALSAP